MTIQSDIVSFVRELRTFLSVHKGEKVRVGFIKKSTVKRNRKWINPIVERNPWRF